MELAKFESIKIEPETSVILETDSRVVRAGVFKGLIDSPAGQGGKGILLSISPDLKTLEWIDVESVKAVAVTFPAEQ